MSDDLARAKRHAAILSRRFGGGVRDYTFHEDPALPWAERLVLLDGGPPINPEDLDALWPEVEAEMAQELAVRQAKRQGEQIGDRLAKLFHGQPLAVRLQFGPQFSQVKGFLDNGDLEAAQAVIENEPAPEGMEAVKAAMLAEFD